MSADRHIAIALAVANEPGDESLAAMIATTGIEAVYDRYRVRLPALDQVAEWVGAWEERGIAVAVAGDPEWPSQVEDLAAPPLALFRTGRPIRAALLRSVSVVGSRAASAAGVRLTSRWAQELAQQQVAVVSGGAFGIDGAAHRGCLAGQGHTIAVLAAGVDVDSPTAHRELLDTVRQTGSVISEFAPGTKPRRDRFLTRNRLIAALTPGTLVVEAAVRSGALATARHADRLLRVVMAVPGDVGRATSAGCHELIADQRAVLVTSAAEVSRYVSGPMNLDTLDIAP